MHAREIHPHFTTSEAHSRETHPHERDIHPHKRKDGLPGTKRDPHFPETRFHKLETDPAAA